MFIVDIVILFAATHKSINTQLTLSTYKLLEIVICLFGFFPSKIRENRKCCRPCPFIFMQILSIFIPLRRSEVKWSLSAWYYATLSPVLFLPSLWVRIACPNTLKMHSEHSFLFFSAIRENSYIYTFLTRVLFLPLL